MKISLWWLNGGLRLFLWRRMLHHRNTLCLQEIHQRQALKTLSTFRNLISLFVKPLIHNRLHTRCTYCQYIGAICVDCDVNYGCMPDEAILHGCVSLLFTCVYPFMWNYASAMLCVLKTYDWPDHLQWLLFHCICSVRVNEKKCFKNIK